MSFTLIDTDYTDKIKNILNNFNLNHLNYNKLHISGSLVLNLIRNEENLDSSDLDLYFNIYKMNKFEIETIISHFIYSGYYLKQPNFESLEDSDLKIKNKHNIKSHIIKQIVTKILNSKNYNNLDKFMEYFSLRNHILTIIKLYNPIINKEIDLIILKPKKTNTIEKLILETFDYDIVKNYTEYNPETNKYLVYSLNKQAIENNIATISISHFNNRILNNIHEFDNFITRYVKYYNFKKYTIYIDKLEITSEYFINMIKLYLDNTVLSFHTFYTSQCKTINYLNINTDITDLSKLFKIIIKINNEEKEIYDYNLRKYINEHNSALSFNENKIGNNIFAYYSNVIIDDIIKINKLILSTDLELIFKQQILNRFKSLHIVDECIICYNKKHLYNIYCGNNHKLCGSCLRTLKNKICPMCRAIMFSK